MRTRLLTQLLVLAVLLTGFAPDALAGRTRNVGAGVRVPATPMWTGGAALAPRAGAPTDRHPDTPALPHGGAPGLPPRGTHAASPVDMPTAAGSAAPSPGAPESSATTQTIVQIQVGACSSHCDGTTETQTAQQQAVTVQAVTGGRDPAQPNHPEQALRPVAPRRHSTHVTRGQIGCLAHCFGTTTRGLRLDGHRRKLRRLLRTLTGSQAPMPASPASPAGMSQSRVAQASYQRQHGLPSLKSQRQRSSQVSITLQSARLSSKLIHDLQSALTAAAPVDAAVNETVQRIWQLQIGCLSHCTHTLQYQQAKQTSTTIQVVAPLATAAAAQDDTAQSIWQLQVGCLVWCFSATEQQRAISRHLTLNSVTAPRPPGQRPPASVQFEATVASQTGGAGVTVVADSAQAMGVPALRLSGERSGQRPRQRHRHVSVAHPPRRNRPTATMPPPPVQTSRAAGARPDGSYVPVAVVAGLIVLLATITASRVAPWRGRR